MKILYFDCFSGISGDMIIGALLDAGLDLDELRAALASLDVPGYTVGAEKTSRNSITGTKFNVTVSEEDHAHRHLKDIVALIDDSRLSDGVKQLSKQTFRALAAAEASIHGESVESVHFHEVGGVDSIIDIVGSFVGLEKLGIEAVYASRVGARHPHRRRRAGDAGPGVRQYAPHDRGAHRLRRRQPRARDSQLAPRLHRRGRRP
jgi:uncharacterized protein (DUF111 family)